MVIRFCEISPLFPEFVNDISGANIKICFQLFKITKKYFTRHWITTGCKNYHFYHIPFFFILLPGSKFILDSPGISCFVSKIIINARRLHT